MAGQLFTNVWKKVIIIMVELNELSPIKISSDDYIHNHTTHMIFFLSCIGLVRHLISFLDSKYLNCW